MISALNTLYLTYDGLTDPLGQSQVLPYLLGLSKKGVDITVISFEKAERFKNGKKAIDDICEQHSIDWNPLKYNKRPPVISTLWDIRKMEKLTMELQRKKNFQLIHCRSYITSLVGLKMKRRYDIPFIFDMRGFFADERVEGNIWNLASPWYKIIYRFFKQKELAFLKDSAKTISLTNKGMEVLKSWDKSDGPFSPIEIIPCCVDLNVFPLQEKKEGPFTLGYLGSIGTWYLLDEMLDFFALLKKEYPNAIFHFLTKDDPQSIITKSKEKGISQESLKIEASERKDIIEKTSQWDYSIFFIKPSFSKKASSPTKQAELMAMGIPVICNAGVGDTDYIIQKYKSGIIVNELNETEYLNVIKTINKNSINFNQVDLRNGAKDYFDIEKGINSYFKIYESIIKNGKA